MKEFFKKYLFVFEWIGAAILIGVGIFTVLDNSILVILVGLILFVFALLRVVPLLKTTPDKVLRIIYAVEILLNLAAGILLVVEGSKGDASSLMDADNKIFGYIIGGVLYLRGFVHFYATSLRKEPNDYVKFFTNLALFTVGTFIIARGGFETMFLAYVILVLACLSALFIGYSGYKHYRNNRYELRAREETKKAVEKEKEQPTDVISDPASKKPDVVVPEKEEKKEEAQL
jgi:hypothetical protein